MEKGLYLTLTLKKKKNFPKRKMSSQSEFEIVFTFIGTDKIVKGDILRFQAPQTFEALRDKTRDKGYYTVRSRANIGRTKSYWMLLVELKKSGEKKEYKEYHCTKEQKKNRAKRNAARKKKGLNVGDKREVDHIKPLSKGGSNGKKNLRVVSKKTNRKKGSK